MFSDAVVIILQISEAFPLLKHTHAHTHTPDSFSVSLRDTHKRIFRGNEKASRTQDDEQRKKIFFP